MSDLMTPQGQIIRSPMDDKLNVERLRELADSATPELLAVSARVMGNMLRLGGEHQRPRAKDWESANYDADGLLVSHLLNSLPAILAMAEDNARLREALDQCSHMLERFTHTRLMDEKHVSAREALTLARRALAKENASA